MIRYPLVLLLAGLCVGAAFAADEAPVPVARCDKADRAGPVPFADLGLVGGGQTLTGQKAIDNDRQLAVCGEIAGDELILHVPPGTIKDTLSLRDDKGLDIRRAQLAAISSWQGDDLHLKLADLGLAREADLGNLWVWGTGPGSGSLLQRISLGNVPPQQVATSRPLNEPNMMNNQPIQPPSSGGSSDY